MTYPTDLSLAAAWLRLELEPGIGPIHARAIINACGTPANLYKMSQDELRQRLGPRLAVRIGQPLEPHDAQLIERALKWATQPDHHLLTPEHANYPNLLAQLDDAPIVLYARGILSCLQKDAVAVVGARHATADGKDRASNFSRQLASWGYCIVSGLAYGIDAAAHRGALSDTGRRGTTLAVMGTGIDVVYPSDHRALADDIVDQGGLLLSGLRLGTPALPAHFPRRNRIVAGLSKGVLVVEAALRSGSLITAREAADLGREVFAIPGSIRSSLSRGPHALIRQGAMLVETAEEIAQELGNLPTAASSPMPTQTALPVVEPDSPVWRAIGYDPVTEDTILRRAGISAAEMQTQLLALLLQGRVEMDAAGRFCRTVSDCAQHTQNGASP